MKIKDQKTSEMRDETDEERNAREKSERDSQDDENDIVHVRAERDRWKGQARTWEQRAKANFESKTGIGWDDVTKAAQAFAELENKTKTDAERATAATTAAQNEAKEARLELARTRVALRKGLTEVQAKRLMGDTEEAMEADADELLKTFRPAGEDGGESGAGNGGRIERRPREQLRPGTGGRVQDPAPDPKKIVDEVMSSSR